MITEIIMFRLPEGMSRDDALAKYRLSIPIWQANPGLIRKAFLFEKNVEAAKLAHGAAFQEGIQSTFGADPEFQYFETPILIDNSIQQVIDEAA